MNPLHRFRPAAGAAAAHLAISAAVAVLCAAVVFGVWYPFPYRQISGGRELFVLLVSVDVVAGPLLTLVVFDRRKPRAELWRDMSVIVALQLAALGYGLMSVHQARPVLLAYEGSRFRAVSAAELDPTLLHEAQGDLGQLSQTGPRLVGVKLASPEDPDYAQSIKQSIEGFHPSFRPSRWLPYEQQRLQAAAAAKPMAELRAKHPSAAALIDAAVGNAGLPIERLAYVPLQSRMHSEWIVVVERSTGWPKAFAPVDGW